jgi:hypothetical protein
MPIYRKWTIEIVSQSNAPNLTIEGRNGTISAYRRAGKVGTTPLMLLQRFHANLDSWHSARVEEIAAEHEVVEKPTKSLTTGRSNFMPTPRSTELRMISGAHPIYIAARCHGCDMPNGRSSVICDFCHAPLRGTR